MIEYEENWWFTIIPRLEGSVLHKAFFLTLPSIFLSALCIYMDEWYPGLREDWGLMDASSSQLWTAVTSTMAFLIVFRTRQAYARFWEGTGLLHQMRGEWFDTASNCVTFSITARPKKPEAVMAFRHTIIRIMSLCHGSALEEIAGNSINLESIDTFGLDDNTLNHLQECHDEYGFNKVEVMLHLLQSLITTAYHDKVLGIPAPILSRVFQTISRGFVNLLNAKKIQDTKFPFPYAQLIAFLLLVLAIMTPVMMSCIVQSKIMCGFFTFMPMFGLYCLNFVAIELEDPFGTDDNDLPLQNFQAEMNNCLMMLLHPNTDMVATVSDRCEMDFHKLRREVCLNTKGFHEQRDGFRKGGRRKTRRLSDFDINNPEKLKEPQVSEPGIASEMLSDECLGCQQKPEECICEMEPDAAWPHERASSKGRQMLDGSQEGWASERNIGIEEGWASERNIGIENGEERLDSMGIDDDGLVLFVGKEPPSDMRRSARMQEPKDMLRESKRSPRAARETPQSTGATSGQMAQEAGTWENDHSSNQPNGSVFSEIADVQPLLARNMQDLISSLDVWTKNVDKEINSLQSNSAILQEALHRFASDLPSIKGQAQRMTLV